MPDHFSSTSSISTDRSSESYSDWSFVHHEHVNDSMPVVQDRASSNVISSNIGSSDRTIASTRSSSASFHGAEVQPATSEIGESYKERIWTSLSHMFLPVINFFSFSSPASRHSESSQASTASWFGLRTITQVPSIISSFACSFMPIKTQLYRLEKDLAHYETARNSEAEHSPGRSVYDKVISDLKAVRDKGNSTADDIAKARAHGSRSISTYLDSITFFTTQFSLRERLFGTNILGTPLNETKDVKKRISAITNKTSPENTIFSSSKRIVFSQYRLNPSTPTFPYNEASIPAARGESLGKQGLESIRESKTGPVGIIGKFVPKEASETNISPALLKVANGGEWERAQIIINGNEVVLKSSEGIDNINNLRTAVCSLTRKNPSDLELLELFALISKDGRVSGFANGTTFVEGINLGTSTQQNSKERDRVTLTLLDDKIQVFYESPAAYVQSLFIPLLETSFSIACNQGGIGETILEAPEGAPKFVSYRNWSCVYTPLPNGISQATTDFSNRFEMLYSYQGYELEAPASA